MGGTRPELFHCDSVDGLTPGHGSPADVRYRTFDPEATVLKCFRCHSTGPLSLGATYGIEPREPGIHCESCHGPGGEHVNSRGRAGTILNPGRMNAAALNDFCGVCHRTGPPSDWTDKWQTRHQPSYLAQAACFRKSGALTCLTCHDPHSPLDRTAASYDKRCNECHKRVRHRTANRTARACVDCHMPQVAISAQLKFTNHWIGIYSQDGSTLVPTRSMAKSAPPLAPGDNRISPPADPASLRPLFEQVLADRERELGPNHPRVARGASDLGLFLNKTGDAGDAETALRHAFEIDRRNSAPEAAEDAENLGEVVASSGRNNEAIPLFEQATADPKIAARAFANLAILDAAHAEDHYRAALDAEQRAEAPDSKRIAILVNNLALTVEQKRDYRSAEALLRRALAIQVRSPGAQSPAAAPTLSNLGSLLESAGQHAEAEARCTRSDAHF
jgi:tetratricopeptide (TPR) repeat protein